MRSRPGALSSPFRRKTKRQYLGGVRRSGVSLYVFLPHFFRATCVPNPVGEMSDGNHLLLQRVINGQTRRQIRNIDSEGQGCGGPSPQVRSPVLIRDLFARPCLITPSVAAWMEKSPVLGFCWNYAAIPPGRRVLEF